MQVKIHRKRRLPVRSGDILREIEQEGSEKGLDWRVPPLFFLRKEQTEENIERILIRLQRKINRQRVRTPSQIIPDATREDALEYLPFPRYTNTKGVQRRYSKKEAQDLKKLIKKVRRYI